MKPSSCLKKSAWILLTIAALIAATITIMNLVSEPSNDRAWAEDQKTLPSAEFNGDSVTVRNIRNFSYTSTTSWTANYYDKTFDLNKIRRAWYIVEPFSGIPGSAHTFLSFEFEGDQFVAVSVEIRKEQGESFHPIKGLFNQYELMYVVADERDAIKLRSNYRNDQVYVYPSNAEPETVKKLFVDIMNRVNSLKEQPEFYNTITNTCTTNIAEHINNILPNKVPWLSWRIMFPAHSDKLAYELGMLDTELSFEDARERFYINERAMKYKDAEDFEVKIRGEK